MKYKTHTNCRVCNSNDMTPYLDLGLLPLSNNLAKSIDDPIHDEKYPLIVMLCNKCGLSQLSIVVNPEILFSNYVYRSSISNGYINHCKCMAINLQKKYGLNEDSFIIDIAGNDGALLKEFKDIINCKVLNIDPAENLVKICEDKGVRMFCTFWGKVAATHLIETGWMKADLIIATNVFAHVDNIREFLSSCKMCIKDSGKIILEFPYLIDFIDNKEFDTIYFEHLSYFSIGPLKILCSELGLNIENVAKQDIHGGSVRVTIGYGKEDESVIDFIQKEIKYRDIDIYTEFAKDVKLTIAEFAYKTSLLNNVAGFAASAKGNTLLNCSDVKLKYIIDQTPEKIGKFSPGVKTEIVDISILEKEQPDYIVILSWNFADEIIYKCKSVGFTGKFIIPIPNFKIIE